MDAHSGTLLYLSQQQHLRERDETNRRRDEFDAALQELRVAKERLERAAELYLERLEGARNERSN